MPAIPFGQYLKAQIELSSLSANTKAKVISLLGGVKGGDGTWYHYSCPFPFRFDASQNRALGEAFRDTLILEAGKLTIPTELDEFGLRALFEKLFILNDAFCRVAIYPGYASGDMYGFGAAMAIDANLQMVLMKDSAFPGRIDRSAATKAFLEEVVGSGRVTIGQAPKVFAKNPDPVKKPKGAEGQFLAALDAILWTIFNQTGTIHCAVDLFFGTRYVAMKFAADPKRKGEPRRSSRKNVRKKWLELAEDGGFRDTGRKKKIEDFIESCTGGLLPTKAKIIVLWSRFTGKTGGAHVEYDTSASGLRQLISCAFACGAEYVFIAGDSPKWSKTASLKKQEERRKLLAEIQREITDSPTRKHHKLGRTSGPRLTERKIIDLTEFWNRDGWYTCNGAMKPNKPKRIDQFKLFEVLAENNTVKHFGARSGNLESLALLGYTVRYFEDGSVDRSHESIWDLRGLLSDTTVDESEEDEIAPVEVEPEALDKKRMEPWHRSVGYGRIKISTVPTRSGKYLIAQKLGGQPRWTYDKRLGENLNDDEEVQSVYSSMYANSFEMLPPDFASIEEQRKAVTPFFKPPDVKNESMGFASKDLMEIANYFMFH